MLPPPPSRRVCVLVAILLAIHAAVLVDVARKNSETFDEPMYLLASRSYWERFDFSFNREHPPLSKLLIGLPLELAGLKLPADYHTAGATQLRFVYEINDDPQRTLFLGRLPMILVGLLLGLYVFRFGRLFGGDRIGIASLVAYLLTPGITGNTPLAALDLGAAAGSTIALYYLARMRMAPTHGGTLVAGVAFGLAQLTKFSNLLLVPVYGLLAVWDAIRERSLKPLLRLAALGLVGLSTMFLGYGCEMRTVASVKNHPRYDDDAIARAEGSVFRDPLVRRVAAWFGDRPVPMLTYLKGYDYLKRESSGEGHSSYFRGETSKGQHTREEGEEPEGWKTFYLVLLAVKTPVGLLALTAFSLLLLWWLPKTRGAEGPLLLFPVLLFVYFSLAPSQLGYRYVLPVLPALAILAARTLTIDAGRHARVVRVAAILALVALPVGLAFAFPERGPITVSLFLWIASPVGVGVWLATRRSAAAPAGAASEGALPCAPTCAPTVVLLVVAAIEVAAQHPDHLMFFNAFAGGPDHGYRISSVGDDWGQGASQLAELQRERGWGEIAYDYYGTGMPEIYGLKFRAFNGERNGVGSAERVAVHAVQLTRERFRTGSTRYVFLDGLEPIARANAIFVFDVPK